MNRPKTPSTDVYAYGVIAEGTLYRLQKPFPRANGYGEIVASQKMVGGEAANSAIALSRLGLRVVLDGCRLGRTCGARHVLRLLKNAGVDTTPLRMLRRGTGLCELVMSDGPTRTVFGNYGVRMASTCWNAPSKRRMARARMACVDPALGRESLRASRMARRLRVPYVTIDRPCGEELGREAAALIVSHDFLSWRYPKTRITKLFAAYRRRATGLVVFTSGSGTIRYGRRQDGVHQLQPPRVRAMDTTGAGDAFRAGVIFGLLHGWPDAQIVRYAAAVGALTCTTAPATQNSPRHADVRAFLASA